MKTIMGLVWLLGVGLAAGQPAGDEAAWSAWRAGEAVGIIRHALAPGTGDPAGFTLGDCSTQRNLSDSGREQARRIGDRLRAQGIESADIYSSQWCRCLETADLLNLGPVTELNTINSFFANPATRPEQTEALRSFLTDLNGTKPVLLVTHQVNITALTGVFPASGELVIFRLDDEGKVMVLKRVAID